MKQHFLEQIPFLAAGQLPDDEAIVIQNHIQNCAECASEWKFWNNVSEQITWLDKAIDAPTGLDQKVIKMVKSRSSLKRTISRTISLLISQAYLVRRDMWPASACVMALGVITVFLSNQPGILTFLAPLVAAVSLAAIYGPQNDPASELTLAAPTSPWRVLLARLTLVSGYNLLIALFASLVLLVIMPLELLGALILSWLGPLTLLSAIALMLSLWIGTGNAIMISFGLWTIQYVRAPKMLDAWPALYAWDSFLVGYREFWHSPGLLMVLAAVILILTLISTRFTEANFRQSIG